MRARIQKWGNSLALRIPKAAADEAGLTQGVEVELQATKNRLTIKPRRKKTYSLASLVRKIRPDNIHKEVDWGPPMGREAW